MRRVNRFNWVFIGFAATVPGFLTPQMMELAKLGSPPMAGLLESRLWRDSHARSLRNKGLGLKSLFSFDLESPRLSGWGSGMGAFASSRRRTPFRPDLKVKLEKSEGARGGYVMTFCGVERCRRFARPLLDKREKGRTPSHFGTS